MNIKKLVLPLLALIMAPVAFAQQDGYEPDWNNPDEVGNVQVCFGGHNTADGWENDDCVWFTVDMLPAGSDELEADPSQVKVLTDLYTHRQYGQYYKVAENVQPGASFAVKDKHVYLYKLPSANWQERKEGFKWAGFGLNFLVANVYGQDYLIMMVRAEKDVTGKAMFSFPDSAAGDKVTLTYRDALGGGTITLLEKVSSDNIKNAVMAGLAAGVTAGGLAGAGLPSSVAAAVGAALK